MNSTKITRGPFPQTQEIPVPLTVHESVSPLAAELLMKVCEVIARAPCKYDQSKWCGSACCIIGWMEALGQLRSPSLRGEGLGLNETQYHAIFLYKNWPEQFMAVADIEGGGLPAEYGIARIEHFLRTGT